MIAHHVAARFGSFLAIGLLCTSSHAHHSFAIFDHTRTYTLEGTISSFQWTNPHGYIDLEVAEGPDGISRYTLELTSINMLRRAGWRSSDLQPGQRIVAIAAPLLDGQPGGLLLELTREDGTKLVPPVPAIDTFTRTP